MPNFLTESILGTGLNFGAVLICIIASLVAGLIIALIYMYKNQYSKSFVVTLVLLPAMVQIVIMLVNGNIGAGIAVMGAFNLVRFRSIPGSAREISSIFFAMAIGLATGMGYLFYALVFLVVVGFANIILSKVQFGGSKDNDRMLRITVSEDMDYDNEFQETLEQYTTRYELQRIKTTNMGSLFEIQYDVNLKNPASTKEFLDEIRCRNGNLNISLGRPATDRGTL